MLKVYLTESQVPAGREVLRDVEKIWAQTPIPMSEYSKRAVHNIDGGTLLTPTTYRSRFGQVISTTYLSTGCKAALIAPLVGGVLDISEAGVNILPTLFSFLTDGELLYTPGSEGMLTSASKPAGNVLWGARVCQTAQDILDAQKCLGR